MNRRSFLGRLIDAVLGTLGVVSLRRSAPPSDPGLRAVHVLRCGRWQRVRMKDVRKGDSVRLEGVFGVWRATSGPWFNGKSWGIMAEGHC